MPVIDNLATEYSSEVDFVAPAWKAGFEATEFRAMELLVSGEVMWGLDEEEEIFGLYGVPYQPVTILIAADQTVVEEWAGVRPEDEIRAAIEDLIALSG